MEALTTGRRASETGRGGSGLRCLRLQVEPQYGSPATADPFITRFDALRCIRLQMKTNMLSDNKEVQNAFTPLGFMKLMAITEVTPPSLFYRCLAQKPNEVEYLHPANTSWHL